MCQVKQRSQLLLTAYILVMYVYVNHAGANYRWDIVELTWCYMLWYDLYKFVIYRYYLALLCMVHTNVSFCSGVYRDHSISIDLVDLFIYLICQNDWVAPKGIGASHNTHTMQNNISYIQGQRIKLWYRSNATSHSRMSVHSLALA